MNRNVTHKQHYVWRYYLRPWCTCVNEKDEIYFIWWNNKRIYKHTDVFTILRADDFYKFDPLNKLELFLLDKMFYGKNSETLTKINDPIVEFGKLLSIISDKTIDKDVNDVLIQIGEEIQSTIEKSGIEYLDYLYNKDLSFLADDDKKCGFLLFIAFQYFRTKKIKDNIVDTMNNESHKTIALYKRDMKDDNDYTIDWGHIFNYGSILLSNALSYNLLIKEMHFQLLVSNNARFIVADQPIYNELASDKDLLLFYPITPYLAIRGSINYKKDEVINIDDNEVLAYNYKTYKISKNFFMGKEEIDVGFKCHE